MKRFLCLMLCLLFVSSASAGQERFNLKYGDFFDLEPGLYEVGKDFQDGKYDIRFIGMDKSISISYSYDLNLDGTLDLSNIYSFSLTFNSDSNWWNASGFLVNLFSPGYLLIENGTCRMWVEK